MLPTRFDIVFDLVLIVLCGGSAVGCVLRGEWLWAAAGAAAMAFFVRDLLGVLAGRRYSRPSS